MFSPWSRFLESSRCLKNPRIIQRVTELTLQAFASNAPKAQSVLVGLMERSNQDSVRLQAAVKLLEVSGFSAVMKHEHRTVVDDRSDEEIIDRIKLLASDLDLDDLAMEVLLEADPDAGKVH